jgi:hypothetical protein
MREIGRLENLKIAMIGDLANGRTVHSLAALLSLYPGVKMYFVAPDVVRMKDDVKDFLSAKNVPWEEVDDLHEVGGALRCWRCAVWCWRWAALQCWLGRCLLEVKSMPAGAAASMNFTAARRCSWGHRPTFRHLCCPLFCRWPARWTCCTRPASRRSALRT